MNKKLILFIAANPVGPKLGIINWKTEHGIIDNIINNTKLSKHFTLKLEADATPDSFLEKLEDNPWIIHFSGHGNGGEIVLQGSDRAPVKIKIATLIDNLRHLDGLECIVFTSCLSRELIQETRKIVKYSIGFEGILSNKFANQFVKDFYKCLDKPDVNTIHDAYQRTMYKYNFRQQTESTPVFESRRIYIMNEIILKKKYELKAQLSADGQREYEVLELEMQGIRGIQEEIEALNAGSKSLLSKLLVTNPFASGVFWFVENRADLVIQLAQKVLTNASENQQSNFADELDFMFEYLESSLVNFDYRDVTKADLAMIDKKFNDNEYKKAFDALPNCFPNSLKSDDFKMYLLENIAYIKNLI